MPTIASSYPRTLSLVHYPDPVLLKRAAPVTTFDADLATFCQRMFEVMDQSHGVGLAAPQVGVSARIFVTDHSRRDDGPGDRRVWINPRIERAAGSTTYEEGCLSFPGIYAEVQRHNTFDIIAQDVWGVERRISLDVAAGDFLGIVVQHELDHLDGTVFIQRLQAGQLSSIRKPLSQLETAYRKATGRPGAVIKR